jgi:hypothetical protein
MYLEAPRVPYSWWGCDPIDSSLLSRPGALVQLKSAGYDRAWWLLQWGMCRTCTVCDMGYHSSRLLLKPTHWRRGAVPCMHHVEASHVMCYC